MGKITEHVKCNLCGADNYQVIFKKETKILAKKIIDEFKASGGEVLGSSSLFCPVVKCNKCGLIYVNPRIKNNIILKNYSASTNETYTREVKNRERTFQKSLRLIGKYTKGGKILDIGTAGGSFLYMAKKFGWKVYGIEINKWLCEWGRTNYGLYINQGTIFDQKYPDEYFDVITLWDVLEHTTDPRKVLEECNRILKRDGLLVVSYPDIGSYISKIMGRRWLFLIPSHLFYFTRKTIIELLHKTDFETITIKPHFQSMSLDYLISRIQYNRLLYNLGKIFIKTFGVEKNQITYWLGQTVVIARKTNL